MTFAATRRYALGLCGAAGLAAAIMSVVLLSAVVNSPEQVVVAMGEQDLETLLGLVTDRLVAAVRQIVRFL
jgi:uncharacterized protein (DUF1501 family)